MKADPSNTTHMARLAKAQDMADTIMRALMENHDPTGHDVQDILAALSTVALATIDTAPNRETMDAMASLWLKYAYDVQHMLTSHDQQTH